MKTKFLMSVAILGTLSLSSAVYAQDVKSQQDAQSVSSSTTASPARSTDAASDTSGYGGVKESTNASGRLTGSGWTTCGHLPQCNADSGH